jgi:hypothetical protein
LQPHSGKKEGLGYEEYCGSSIKVLDKHVYGASYKTEEEAKRMGKFNIQNGFLKRRGF